MKRYKVNRNKRCKTNLNKRTESRRIKPWVAREAEHGSTETYTSGRTSAARRQQAARKQGRSNYHSTRQTFHQTSKGRGSGARVQSREGERPQPQTVRGNSSSNDLTNKLQRRGERSGRINNKRAAGTPRTMKSKRRKERRTNPNHRRPCPETPLTPCDGAGR
jgi:hypothetical protein